MVQFRFLLQLFEDRGPFIQLLKDRLMGLRFVQGLRRLRSHSALRPMISDSRCEGALRHFLLVTNELLDSSFFLNQPPVIVESFDRILSHAMLGSELSCHFFGRFGEALLHLDILNQSLFLEL